MTASTENNGYDYDYVIIGSGFGGSVSALRLSEKGYKVLVIEKGKWFNKADSFPKTNWQLSKWLWAPRLGLKGILRIGVYRHVTALSGTGVGGGSLVYANTLPVPGSAFFNSGNWEGLADWEGELKPFYATAKSMLGAATHPYTSRKDKAMQTLAENLGGRERYEKTDVAVYFGKPGETVEDPYFNGQGPSRTGCILCGACMTGCRYNAKNTLDKNYLFLAQNLGATILAEREVTDVKPLGEHGENGYEISHVSSFSFFKSPQKITCKGVIFSGGVTGTVNLLLKLKATSLPKLSDMVGKAVRTNSESLIGVTTYDRKTDLSEGIAIGSIVHIDEHRNLEPAKYGAGSGFWRIFMSPMTSGKNMGIRFWGILKDLFLHPIDNLRVIFTDDFAKRTMIMLYMESIDSKLTMVRSRFGFLSSKLESGTRPSAFNPLASKLAAQMAAILNGKPMVILSESLFGIPTTAHILGGACMGKDAATGVIDAQNKVFNYQNMYVCDGSAISANPGVNPSLSITAITERAMHHLPHKTQHPDFIHHSTL
ncbi:MAG: GMC family oxidoreductase [Saprospiraceae bacterium]|nr:GMC family oxidoreductase [Saprospiraceae bacterium]